MLIYYSLSNREQHIKDPKMNIPTNEEILKTLDKLNESTADELETQWLEFKPWNNPKDEMKIAVEYAVCFANSQGGVVVFGVSDKVRGRSKAIHGVKGHVLDTWERGIYGSISPHMTVKVEELPVPEGTGRLLVVRVPEGDNPPYGTSMGLFKKRVGKNCMPMDQKQLVQARISTGAVDWSGEIAHRITLDDLDPLEIARARSYLRSRNPSSELLKLSDVEFLQGIEAIRNGEITNTGLLLFGQPEVIGRICPQNQVHYVHQISGTKISRNDVWRVGLLQVIGKMEDIFSGPANPEEEMTVGLAKLRIPSFPLDVVREAALNAICHRDYSNPGEVLIRHMADELVVTSPGGFIGGITPDNILRADPIARNRTLANALMKLRLVDSVGIGRKRIFMTMLQYGKRMPQYEANESYVTLRLYNGAIDKKMAKMVADWSQKGKEIGLDGLIILSYLKEHRFIYTSDGARLLQTDRDNAIRILDHMSHPEWGILERKGHTRAATYNLTKSVARDLIGKVAYTTTRGIDQTRYAELVRTFVRDHGTITNSECRELLGLGNTDSARVEASRYLKRWSGPDGFLIPEGKTSKRKYRLKPS